MANHNLDQAIKMIKSTPFPIVSTAKHRLQGFINAVIVGRTSKDRSDTAALLRLREHAHKIQEERLKSQSEIDNEIEDMLQRTQQYKLDPQQIPISKRLYYKNGKIAKPGDAVFCLSTKQTGLIHAFNEHAVTCNAQLVCFGSSRQFVTVIDCVSLDDLSIIPIPPVGLACSSDS